MPLYRVYVLRNPEGRFYVGLSDDIEKRRAQHNSGGSRCTKTRGPWTLAWQSANLSLGDARNLENRLKRQGRSKGFYSITGLPRKAHNPAAAGLSKGGFLRQRPPAMRTWPAPSNRIG